MKRRTTFLPAKVEQLLSRWCCISVSVLLVFACMQWTESYGQSQGSNCKSIAKSETDDVFNQALSTVRLLTNEALKAGASGRWQPDGSFKKSFFSNSATALREIRGLLAGISAVSASCAKSQSQVCANSAVPKEELIASFNKIFQSRFPRGLQHLKRLQTAEAKKFVDVVDELPENYISCVP